MGWLFLVGLITIWTSGAAVTVKADAMLAERETWWSDLLPSMFVWPLIAVLICLSKHRTDGDKYVY
jgi:hypothetical protein